MSLFGATPPPPASATTQIFSTIITTINSGVTDVVAGASATVQQSVAGPFAVALLLYVILYALAIMRGTVREAFNDFSFRVLKLVLIYSLAVKSAIYNEYVGSVITQTLPQFAQLTSTSNTASMGGAIDAMANAVFSLTLKIGDTSYLTGALLAALVGIAGYFVAAVATIMVIIATLPLAILAAVGPVFVGLALFEVTRRFTFGWVAQVVNFIVLQLLLSGTLSIFTSFITKQAQVQGDPLALVLPVVGSCTVVILLLAILPRMAAGIANGAAGWAPTPTGAVLTASRVAAISNAAGRAAGRAASRAGRAFARPAAAQPSSP